MEFKLINNGHNCKCLSQSVENYEDTFARKVDATQDFKLRDFKTHHERGVLLEDNSCQGICGFRGISIEIWNDESKGYISNKFSLTFGISPQYKKPKSQIGVFKLKEGAGKVKHTPNQKHGVEIFHYDLYKSDTFAIDMLELVEMIPLFNPNV